MSGELAIGLLCLCLAAVAAAIEVRDQRRHDRFCSRAARTQGVVSRLARRHLSRNEPAFDDPNRGLPIVRFTASNGIEYEFDARDAPREVGSEVVVAYLEKQPSSSRLARRQRKPGCVVILLVLAIVAFYAAFRP